MQHESLGLFDTPPERRDIQFGVAAVGLMVACLILILPLRDMALPEVKSFVPMVDGMMFVCQLITATLLYSQTLVFRSQALLLLASGYVLGALLIILHALTFPGAFSSTGLFGAGLNTAGWLAAFWRIAFPVAVVLYGVIKSASENEPADAWRAPPVLLGILAAVALAVFAMLAAVGYPPLPSLFASDREGVYPNLLVMNAVTIAVTIGAMGIIFRRDKSVLGMWLLVALGGWLTQSLLNLPLHARFTLGWYGLFVMMMMSTLAVMLALIAETNRIYAHLALSTAARAREREARSMTMDAVAAAIAHEVGQPLAAMTANASASLNWLNRDRPEVGRASEATRAVLDSGRRSFDIIRTIRTILAPGPRRDEEVSLNDLVRETTRLLARELAGAKISLQLALDDDLPPVLVNKVQMQQVLINLVTNAIEALVLTRKRVRRIAIRSRPLDDDKILLEVSDNGSGLASEDMTDIFAAFSTTKETGTGLGLSLCRTIVEEHGGRIWATGGDKHGATFHVQLPRSRSPAANVRVTQDLVG